MQLATAKYGRQFVDLLQRKPYLVVWAILLEEFPLQVRTHIAGINLHLIPLPFSKVRNSTSLCVPAGLPRDRDDCTS